MKTFFIEDALVLEICFSKDLSFWTGSGQVILSGFGVDLLILHASDSNITILHNDDRIMLHFWLLKAKTC